MTSALRMGMAGEEIFSMAHFLTNILVAKEWPEDEEDTENPIHHICSRLMWQVLSTGHTPPTDFAMLVPFPLPHGCVWKDTILKCVFLQRNLKGFPVVRQINCCTKS